ncbi:MAG TPA: 4-hydroxythreonine-4-phosphate dehydrogenase PdxA, partial [Polyangiaceae bacterium]
PLLVVSVGCPAGIGPEVSVRAAAQLGGTPAVLVGDEATLRRAARLVGVSEKKFVAFDGGSPSPGTIAIHSVGPELAEADVVPGRPSERAGAAQLEYIEAAYALAREKKHRSLVTGPVSKAAIARSGLRRARHFLGHTEWLRDLDRAKSSVMCFASERLVTSLVTTHVPLARVPRELTPEGVSTATIELVHLLRALGHRKPRVAVSSLNPHAGESELLGSEERRAIVPGIEAARRALGRRAELVGPIGAETAYRKAYAGAFAGVVAMYHDQATIPMKLVAFGDAVNVTMGLGVVRTSVDHGTAYDIAWQGRADADGMLAAMRLAARLSRGARGG